MSDLHLDFPASPGLRDDAAREAQHALLASLLGAYADGELPRETASQIDAHLLGCGRCRREVDVHLALHSRLAETAEPIPALARVDALRARIDAAVRSEPPVAPAAIDRASAATSAVRVASVARPVVRRATGALAVLLALVLAFAWSRDRLSAGAGIGPAADPDTVALLAGVLRDYRRVIAADLPGRARDLDAVRAAVPFPVEPARSPALRLLAAWTTDIEGQPAAVLAYRWNDRILLQYVIADDLLFRSPGMRAALATRRQVAARSAGQGMLAWSMPAGGSVVVGDIDPRQIGGLWGAATGR